MAIVISFKEKLYIRILHVANRESFQDPNGFAYFAITLHPSIQHTVIDTQFLRSNRLIYEASGVALPSLNENVYAFVLGNGEKKIPGEQTYFLQLSLRDHIELAIPYCYKIVLHIQTIY